MTPIVNIDDENQHISVRSKNEIDCYFQKDENLGARPPENIT
jgi:hypothetical protein